jgi:hypothetical protein
MSDAWYYAEVDIPVGPISILELKRILHRLKDWKERLVWHSSFNDWCKAGAVPDLTARADLLWDEEARGLCLRIYGDGSKSFIFVYCINNHQRFCRAGPALSRQCRGRLRLCKPIPSRGHPFLPL